MYLVIDMSGYDQYLAIAVFAGIAGSTASLIGSYVFRLPWWWFFINLVFPIAVVGSLTLHVSPWIYFGGFAILLATNWNAVSTRAPLYLTNRATSDALISILPHKRHLTFVDLGSGVGGTLYSLAKSRPDDKFIGVESAPLPFTISKIRQAGWRLPNLEIRYGNIWKMDLGKCDVVYCFLSSAPMTKLFDKARSEMQSDSLFISNTFHVDGHESDNIVVVNDSRKTNLLIWRM